MLKPIVGAACLCLASMASAQTLELSGHEISTLVAGATVEIDTPTGTKIPVRYTHEGRMSGEARDLAWYLGSPTDVGRWWVAGDQLCHKWIRWFNGEPQCMRLAREGRQIRWRGQDGNSGTASIASPAPVAASTLLALPRVFPRRITEPVAPVAPPPALAAAPQQRPPADTVAAATPPPPPPPAVREAIVETPPAPVAAPAATAIRPPPPKQAEPKQVETRQAETRQTETSAPPQRAAQPLFMVANVRHDDVLNVRSGPSAEFDIVGALPPGSRGIAIAGACRSQWCPVQHRATTGWVNSAYLAPEAPLLASLHGSLDDAAGIGAPAPAVRDSPEAPRSCLKPAARALLERIEQKFGPVRVVSTCRPGAMIAGTNHPSRHASGNAVDFDAGGRKAAILEWLIANHRAGGTMTYAGMDHIHVDIGPHFVSLAGGRIGSSWSSTRRD
jgi:hypothetical protein